MNLSPRQEQRVTVTPQPTIFEVLERLWIDKHTGPVTIHLQSGVVNVVEIPGETTRIVLDRRRGA